MGINEKEYFYIYETTNLVNGKNYIGQHVTTDLNDGYLGSGKALKAAIKKYGRESFKKEILLFAINQAALNFIEKCLVTPEFINRDDNYNMKEGGHRGEYSQATKKKISETKKSLRYSPPKEVREKISKTLKGRKVPKEVVMKSANTRRGMKQTEKARHNMSKPFPDVRNTETGEEFRGNHNLYAFTQLHGIDYRHFYDMTRGKRKACGAWELLK